MPNGRGQCPNRWEKTGPSNAIQAAHMQLTNGIEPKQYDSSAVPAGANRDPAPSQDWLDTKPNLAQQQAHFLMPGSKPMPNPGGPPKPRLTD